MGIWVPLYTPPSDEYNKLIASVEKDACLTDSFHGTVLTGPRSGPPDPADKDERALYRERFSVVADTKQWTAFGYVTTLYGKRDLGEVVKDIEKWLSIGEDVGFGDQVQGIWVDNVASNIDKSGLIDYYTKIAQYIQDSFPGKLIAFNPGTSIPDCKFYEANGVSFVNAFEDSYEKWKRAVSDDVCRLACPCASKVTRCIASVHNLPPDNPEESLQKAMSLMADRAYSAMFLTDGVMPKHYLQLPSFWPSVISAACSTTLPDKPTFDPAECAAWLTPRDARYSAFCPKSPAPETLCYATIRPKVYAPETYTNSTAAAVINLGEVQLLVNGAVLPNTSVIMTMSSILNWNSSQIKYPNYLPLGPWFCNDGNTTTLMTWSTTSVVSGKTVTTTYTNTGSGQICQTATAPYNGYWDPCPWLTAAYDCKLGKLTGVRIWNRQDTCSIDCRARTDKFQVDAVYQGVLVGTFPLSGGSTTPMFDLKI